jgi:hypothetical protein
MLYNKTALIEALLNKASRPLDERFSHVRSLKDVLAVHLQPNASRGEGAVTAAAGAEDSAMEQAPFQCPVTKLPFNGRHPFFAVRPTGHVVSERALAMTAFKVCPVTDTPLAPAPPPPAPSAHGTQPEADSSRLTAKKPLSPDLLPLALLGDELEVARAQLVAQRQQQQEGSARPRKRHSAKAAQGKAALAEGAAAKSDDGPDPHKRARPSQDAPGGSSAAAPSCAHSQTAAPSAPHGGKAAAVGVNSSVSRTVAAAKEELARKSASAVYSALFLPQHVREEAERAVREGRDFMTRAIQPGVKKQ